MHEDEHHVLRQPKGSRPPKGSCPPPATAPRHDAVAGSGNRAESAQHNELRCHRGPSSTRAAAVRTGSSLRRDTEDVGDESRGEIIETTRICVTRTNEHADNDQNKVQRIAIGVLRAPESARAPLRGSFAGENRARRRSTTGQQY